LVVFAVRDNIFIIILNFM